MMHLNYHSCFIAKWTITTKHMNHETQSPADDDCRRRVVSSIPSKSNSINQYAFHWPLSQMLSVVTKGNNRISVKMCIFALLYCATHQSAIYIIYSLYSTYRKLSRRWKTTQFYNVDFLTHAHSHIHTHPHMTENIHNTSFLLCCSLATINVGSGNVES